MSPHWQSDHRYDPWSQDTHRPREEEYFAAEMGQPSDKPPPHHRLAGDGVTDDTAAIQAAIDEAMPVKRYEHRPAVLAQTPVQCHKCRRMAREGVDTIVLDGGKWFHEGCVGEES